MSTAHIPFTSPGNLEQPYDGPPRNVASIDQLKFDENLQPKNYSIAGTSPDSKILITDVWIIDATGKEPYHGDVLVVGKSEFIDTLLQPTYIKTLGERFAHVGEVPEKESLIRDPKVRVFHGNGRTLIPGLGDAHTHLSWNGGDLGRLGELGIEEHTLLTARSARCFLDSGYTMLVMSRTIMTFCSLNGSVEQVFRSSVSKETSRHRYSRCY